VEYHTGAVVLDALVKQDKEAIIQAGKRPRALDGEDITYELLSHIVERSSGFVSLIKSLRI